MSNTVRFPKMFNNNKTAIVKDIDATYQNIRTLLLSPKMTLFGDPNFGTNLRRLQYEVNNFVLRDIIIDNIYTAINTYIPQIQLARENISLDQNRNTITVKIYAKNITNQSYNLYEINLITVEEI